MAFHSSISIPPQPTLLRLVAMVQEHIDKRRRSGPKWKFRLAPELVMQIQPHLPGISKRGGWAQRHELSFEGLAYQAEGVDAKTFADPQGGLHVRFVINKHWEFRCIGMGPFNRQAFLSQHPESPHLMTQEQLAEFFQAARIASEAARDALFIPLRDRVVAAFERGFFGRLRPTDLLGDSCICCGRELTDPISQARFIGPECARSSSVDVPWLYDLQPQTAE